MSSVKTMSENTEAVRACLCCMCGSISLERDWTYWQMADDEAPDWDGKEWRPSLPGESDPMMLCPACGWPHRDTDDGSGVYEGTLAEMEIQREKDLPEMGESWAVHLAERAQVILDAIEANFKAAP